MCDIKYQDLIRILRKDWTDECLIFLKSSSSGELNDMTLKKYADKIDDDDDELVFNDASTLLGH